MRELMQGENHERLDGIGDEVAVPQQVRRHVRHHPQHGDQSLIVAQPAGDNVGIHNANHSERLGQAEERYTFLPKSIPFLGYIPLSAATAAYCIS